MKEGTLLSLEILKATSSPETQDFCCYLEMRHLFSNEVKCVTEPGEPVASVYDSNEERQKILII